MQNKPVMGMPLVLGWNNALKLHLHLERSLANGNARAVANPEDVRINGNRRFAERYIEDNVCCLTADSRQCFERLTRAWNIAAMLLQQLSRKRDYVLRLGAVQAYRLDQLLYALFAKCNHLFRRICRSKQGRSCLVYADIGCLGREHYGNEERKRIDVLKLPLGRGIDRPKPVERLLDLLRCPLRQVACGSLLVGESACVPPFEGGRLPAKSRAYIFPLLPRSCWMFRFTRFRAICAAGHSRPIVSTMTISDGSPTTEPKIFSAVLVPHRSLGRRGFLLLMLIFGGINLATGTMFLMAGAWPVFGFCGLDMLVLYWAFRVNYRRATAYEQVTVTGSELTVRQVSHRGRIREWTLNPVWARLDRVVHAEFGIEQLFLVSHGRRYAIAAFLGPQEKESFALALSAAIGEAKRGETRTPLQ